MKLPEKGFKWFIDLLASKETLVTLLIVMSVFLAVTTFAQESAVIWNIIRILLAATVINLSLCTLQRIRTLSRPVFIIHTGVIVTFIGGGISSFGYVATVNIYEGATVDTVYRWDKKKDMPLGMELTVKKLYEEYYPVPVKVGVLKYGEKHNLFVSKTGESFDLERYRIKVEALSLREEKLKLGVFENGRSIGYADTDGDSRLPQDFPFEFKLVAYANPSIKKTWLDLALSDGDRILVEGATEVNSPLQWEGLKFHHTATNRDPDRNPFVGVQITKDPGTAYVFSGFGIIAFGGIFYLLRRFRGIRQPDNH